MAEGGAIIVECPSCGKRLKCKPELAGKRAKCACGSSFPVPAAGSTASPPPSLGGRAGAQKAGRAAAQAEEKSALLKQALMLGVAVILIVGGIVAVKTLGGGSNKPSLGEDAKVEELISDQSGTEAREWMAGRKGRILSGMTDTQAGNRIDQWYNMGAKKVIAFGGVMSMSVALELPADPDKRLALFDWVNKWHEDVIPGSPKDKDVGQKYLLVRLKL